MTEHGENDDGREETGATADATGDDRVSIEVVVVTIVAAQCDVRTDADAVAEQHLGGRRDPDLRLGQLRPVRREQVVQAVGGTFQRDAANEQDEQNHVRKAGGEPDNLAALVQATPDHQVDHEPGGEQTEQQRPANATHVLDTVGQRENLVLPVVLDRRQDARIVQRQVAFDEHLTEIRPVLVNTERVVIAMHPGQIVLERDDKIVDRPGDEHAVGWTEVDKNLISSD